jgi:DNA modification methylase
MKRTKQSEAMETNTIYNENCLDTLRRMPEGFIDLTVTSPPYDNLRDYKGYSFPFEDIAKELFRVTKQGGVVVWVVGDATVNGSETGTSFRQALFFMECGFNLHDTMIYHKAGFPFPETTRYNPVFEYMFILSKGKPKSINLIADRKNKCAGDKVARPTGQRQVNGELKENSAWRNNKNKEVKTNGIRDNVWYYAIGLGNTTDDKQAFKHPAIFPEKLAADHIHSWSNEGDLVYDPFGGSGTTAKMAHIYKRRWILSEISKEYSELAAKRIDPYLKQTTLF